MKLDFESLLNPPQNRAVKTIDGALLIIAGAGSGKTRVITYRIAYMLERGIPQSEILALTFTNKAANEMETRVKELTQRKLRTLTVSTFHSFGADILRREIEALGFRKNFSIYDEGDKVQAVKDAFRDCKMLGENINIREAARLFSAIKTERVRWGQGTNSAYKEVYEEYQKTLKVYNAVDFDDLIVLPVKLFSEHPDILEKYKKRYRYIMVDEFQDTSALQYKLLKLLADKNICVVGDDDQSIYSWRGANYENIVRFEKDFPSLTEIKLEQNYRSTTTILEAANGIIKRNTNRKDKKLWTAASGGKAIEQFIACDERGEAEFITDKIHLMAVHEKLSYDGFGILLRTNSLMTVIEEALLEANIPYYVSGGTSFFERKEIKDILSYLRLIANTDDDVNLLRIINVPRRGIGKTAITKIGEKARHDNSSLWNAMCTMRYKSNVLFEEASKKEIDSFMTLIEEERGEILGKKELSAKVRALTEKINYFEYLVLENNKNEKLAHYKYSNIETLIDSIKRWEENPDNFAPTLYPYLNKISLLSNDDDDGAEQKGKVNLMTIHASKGLEFPVVFIAGCEEGIMPHERSIEEDEGNIEEERRLFYVAVTRARDKIFITSAAKRCRNKLESERVVSPFIAEIPAHLIEYYDPDKTEGTTTKEDFLAALKTKLAARGGGQSGHCS